MGVETPIRRLDSSTVRQLKATPNPFTSFATLPGHEAERFSLYDISGRKVGTYQGDRVGEGLAPGVYFLRYPEMLKQVQDDEQRERAACGRPFGFGAERGGGLNLQGILW